VHSLPATLQRQFKVLHLDFELQLQQRPSAQVNLLLNEARRGGAFRVGLALESLIFFGGGGLASGGAVGGVAVLLFLGRAGTVVP